MIGNIRIQEWSVEISVLQFILVLLALNTGADLQVKFAGKKLLLSPSVRKTGPLIWTVQHNLNSVSYSIGSFLYSLKQVTSFHNAVLQL